MEKKEFTAEDLKQLNKNIAKIYKNKSNDEYKCKGDIKKSPNYEMLDNRINVFIPTIKGYPKANVEILKKTLENLKKPIWAKQVGAYMVKPDDTNTIYAAYFTICYRALFGEVMHVIVSANATENGFVYEEETIKNRSQSMMWILKAFANSPEEMIKRTLEQAKKITKGKTDEQIQQEAATVSGLGGAIEGVTSLVEATLGALAKVFKSALALNPISFMSALLSRSYDKKVDKFKKFDDLYNETVLAYDEYKKLPQSKRKSRIEHKYLKMIEKYNIKRDNLKKQIDHFDQRANAGDDDDDEVEEKKTSTKKKSDANVKNDETKTPQTSSTVNTSDSTDDEDKKPTNDDFDF